MRRAAALLFSIATLPHAAPIRAEPPPRVTARLDIQRGPSVTECPGEDRLRQEVSLRMGYDPFDPGAKRAVSVSIVRRGDELAGTIIHLDETGQPIDRRDLGTPATTCGCWSLTTYLAVAIAIALSPPEAPQAAQAAAPERDAEPLRCPEPASPPGGVADARPPTPAAPPRPRPAAAAPPARMPLPQRARLALEAGAGGLVGWGPAPGPSGGAFGFLRVRWPRISAALEGRAQPPAQAEGEDGSGLIISRYAGAALVCFHEGPWFGCGAGEIGALLLRRDIAQSDSVAATTTAIGGRAGVEVPLSDRFALQLRADVVLTVTPASLPASRGAAWAMPAVSGLLGAGVAARF